MMKTSQRKERERETFHEEKNQERERERKRRRTIIHNVKLIEDLVETKKRECP